MADRSCCESCRRLTETYHVKSRDEYLCEDCIETLDEPLSKYPNGAPMFAADGMMLDENGNRSIFDDVDQ